MRSLLLLIAIGFPHLANAEPITIDDSQSPDGKYFLSVEPHEDEGTASGTVQIRLSTTKGIESTFEWEGFGVRPGSNAFKVLWNPQSDAFAISFELTRGYMSYDAYARQAAGWIKLEAPDYLSIIFKRQGIMHGGGKGYETPIEWTGSDLLRCDIGGRACTDNSDKVAFYYQAQVWLIIDRKDTKPRFALKKITNLPPSGG